MPKREPQWLKDARRNGLEITSTDTGLASSVNRKQKSVVVPVPPSTNNLFPGKARRFKSKEYKDWLKVALPIIRNLKSPKLYPCEIYIRCGVKLDSRSDIANREKAVTDACVTAEVIPGDSIKYISDVVIRYRPDDGDGFKIEFRNPSED